MRIADFNDLPAAEASRTILTAAKIPHWAEAVVAARPYPDAAALLDTAVTAMQTWTTDDVEAALADHPRIGEKPTGDGASAAMSNTEQAGVDRDDADLLARLAEGNAAYEERFGRIYLVRAKGRDATELLDLLHQRLDNDPATELEVTRGELIQIATLRLEATFS